MGSPPCNDACKIMHNACILVREQQLRKTSPTNTHLVRADLLDIANKKFSVTREYIEAEQW